MTRGKDARRDLTRRKALGILLGAGGVAAFGCTDNNSATTGSSSATGAGTGGVAGTGGAAGSGTAGGAIGTGGAEAGACVVTPEGEIGPYFADDSAAGFGRSNLLSNLDGTKTQTGIPLTLTITVLDTEKSCAPYVNAQIDIWHCNASGVYSDESVESTLGEEWLRGYQMTDASGQVTFVTIIPGWYAGRTTHIHLRIRSTYSTASSTSDGTNTTQLFFDQTFVDTLSTSATPYNAEGKNPTTNASDHVYAGETNGANLLSLAGDNTKGYAASVTIGLPITSSGTSTSSASGPGGMGGPGGGMGGPGGGMGAPGGMGGPGSGGMGGGGGGN